MFCVGFPKSPPPVEAVEVFPKGATAEVVPKPVLRGWAILAGLFPKSPPPVFGVERNPEVPGLFWVPKRPPVFCGEERDLSGEKEGVVCGGKVGCVGGEESVCVSGD